MRLMIEGLSRGKELYLEEVNLLVFVGWVDVEEVLIPELNGTTEEKGEYGNASSTVRTLVCPRHEPFIDGAPFDPLTAACWLE